MDINTSHCRNAATAAEESSSKLREVYEGLDWRDEVYESFEAFVDDVEKASKRIADLAVQAADIADSLADIDVGAIEARFSSASVGGAQGSN